MCDRVVSARATDAEKHGELAGPRRAQVFGAPDLAQPRGPRDMRMRARQPDRCVVAVRMWGSSGSDEGRMCGCGCGLWLPACDCDLCGKTSRPCLYSLYILLYYLDHPPNKFRLMDNSIALTQIQ